MKPKKKALKYPFVFEDSDRFSATFGMWCIRWSDSYSEDGFSTKMKAVAEMNHESEKPITTPGFELKQQEMSWA